MVFSYEFYCKIPYFAIKFNLSIMGKIEEHRRFKSEVQHLEILLYETRRMLRPLQSRPRLKPISFFIKRRQRALIWFIELSARGNSFWPKAHPSRIRECRKPSPLGILLLNLGRRLGIRLKTSISQPKP
jgi:hypothetical protein